MSGSCNPRTDAGRAQQQQTQQQNTISGEGSGSALAAMLKKRREGENHLDEQPENGAEDATGTA